jgi:hypothetical protein
VRAGFAPDIAFQRIHAAVPDERTGEARESGIRLFIPSALSMTRSLLRNKCAFTHPTIASGTLPIDVSLSRRTTKFRKNRVTREFVVPCVCHYDFMSSRELQNVIHMYIVPIITYLNFLRAIQKSKEEDIKN